MKWLPGIGSGILAVVVLIQVVWGQNAVSVQMGQQSSGPQFYSEPAPTQPPGAGEEPIPCPPSDGPVVAHQLVCYNGMYCGEKLTGIAALKIWNQGETVLEYAELAVIQQGRQLRFAATYIPPGGCVLVPEKDRQLFADGDVTSVRCVAAIPLEAKDGKTAVKVEDNGYFRLSVNNLTQQTLGCVRVFYKQYSAEQAMYIGGVTYSAVLTELLPGQCRIVTPYQYASGYAKVVAVVVEM